MNLYIKFLHVLTYILQCFVKPRGDVLRFVVPDRYALVRKLRGFWYRARVGNVQNARDPRTLKEVGVGGSCLVSDIQVG